MGSDTKTTSTAGGRGAHVTASFLTETSFVNWRTNRFLSTQGRSILTKIKCPTSPWRFLNGRKLPSCTTKHLWLVQIGFVEKKKKQIRGKALSQFTRGVPQHISLNHSRDLSPHLAHIAIATIATGHKHTGSSTTGQCTGVCLTTQAFPPQATGSSHRAAIVPAPEPQLRVSCKEILSSLSGCGWWWWNGGQVCWGI